MRRRMAAIRTNLMGAPSRPSHAAAPMAVLRPGLVVGGLRCKLPGWPGGNQCRNKRQSRSGVGAEAGWRRLALTDAGRGERAGHARVVRGAGGVRRARDPSTGSAEVAEAAEAQQAMRFGLALRRGPGVAPSRGALRIAASASDLSR